jgi:hypothetical protein
MMTLTDREANALSTLVRDASRVAALLDDHRHTPESFVRRPTRCPAHAAHECRVTRPRGATPVRTSSASS